MERKEKLRRIIRITWDGFADDLSYSEAIREKLNQMDSEKCLSRILPAQTLPE